MVTLKRIFNKDIMLIVLASSCAPLPSSLSAAAGSDSLAPLEYINSRTTEYFKTRIKNWYKDWKISIATRTYVLEIIKSLAPELYEEIIAVDPTGRNHITFTSNDNIYASQADDGLPRITLTPSFFMHFSPGEQQFLIAHELSHYVLGHLFRPPLPHHKNSSLFPQHDAKKTPSLKKVIATFLHT